MSFPSSPAELDDSRRAASKPPADPHKACKVCGDRANGYNFGVLTCESCKAFFRRNAAKDQEIKCPFSGSCGITAASRRYCQACRLKKCFEVGMNNDWLLESKPPSKPGRKKVKREREEESAGNEANDEPNSSEEDNVKVSKAYLKELMRKAKRPPARCECECRCGFYPPSTRLVAASDIKDAATPSTASVPSPFVPPMNPHSPSTSCANAPSTSCYEMPTTTIIGLPSHIQMPYRVPPIPQSVISMLQPMNQSGHPSILQYPPHVVQQPAHQLSFGSTEDVKLSVSEYSRFLEEKAMLMELSRHQQQQAQSSMGGVMGGVMGGMMGGSEMMQRPISYDKFARLGMDERNLLQELVQAAEPLNKPLDMHFLDGSQLSVMDIVKITETALRRMVCMTRDLDAFKQLPPDDKMELVKGCCSELLILRGVMAFDSRKNAWAHAFAQGTTGMEVKLEVLKTTAGSANYYEEHKRFLESFDDRVRRTETVILVLMAILIFTPDRPKLSLREKIAATRNRYTALLSRVLECEFGLSECGAMYERLMSNLRDIRHINHGLVRIYYGFDPAQLDPLIKELFDLQS